MKQSTKDWWAVAFGIAFLVAVVILVVGGIWARIWAPCEYIDWLPTKDLPGRCLPGGNG